MYFGDCLAWHVIHEDRLHKGNCEDGVTPTAGVIHVRAGRGAMCVAACNALLQEIKLIIRYILVLSQDETHLNLLEIGDCMLR